MRDYQRATVKKLFERIKEDRSSSTAVQPKPIHTVEVSELEQKLVQHKKTDH